MQSLTAARTASRRLLSLTATQTDRVLIRLADALEAATDTIVAANAQDLAAQPADYPHYDRLKLTPARVADMAAGVRQVAELPSPLGRVLMETVRPNGMKIRKVSVPFGVIGIIYEARPNVTTDVFALCFKAGSACVLKGGKEAAATIGCLTAIIHKTLTESGLPEALCTLLPPDHEATTRMLQAVGQIDLVIPRGSSRLINYVRDNARVPVIETGAGICHTYFDLDGDLTQGAAIVNNGKTRRVSVCNALDCLLVHSGRLSDLPQLVAPLEASDVLLYADERAYAALEGHYPAALLEHATPQHYGMEMLSYRMAVKTVDSLDEALEHIARYSSRHSESIISTNVEACERFTREVDAACVYTNLPTSWTDGGQFGFGAEIGISTQKLHARGPMALPEITTYKYIVTGEGQTRE